MKYIIGIDIGTSSTKAVLYGLDGQVYAHANRAYTLFRDASGLAEEDPAEILAAVLAVLTEVNQSIAFTQDQLEGVSFSSANQSLLALDQHYRPITRLLTWADTRAAAVAEQLKASERGQAIYEKTGTPLHPMSLLCKLRWLHKSQPGLSAQAAYYCGIKEYVIHQLCGVWQMDISNASCTGLFNIFDQQWDQEALALAGITREQLPPVVDAYAKFQGLKDQYVTQTGCPAQTTFVQGAFDGALSNLGVGALDPERIAVTIGTSGAVRVTLNHPVTDPQGRLFCYALDRQHYVVGGPVNNGGAVLGWAKDKLFAPAETTEHQLSYERLNEIAAQVPAGANGLLFHPFLGGERAPLWDANARGSFFGLTYLHTKADMLRAVLEGITFNLNTVLQEVIELTGQPPEILATGGFARSKTWCQILADIFACPITIPQDFESSCLGAAVVGLKALGLVSDLSVVQQWLGTTTTYKPLSTNSAVYHELWPIYTRLTAHLGAEYASLADFQDRHPRP